LQQLKKPVKVSLKNERWIECRSPAITCLQTRQPGSKINREFLIWVENGRFDLPSASGRHPDVFSYRALEFYMEEVGEQINYSPVILVLIKPVPFRGITNTG